MGVLQAHTRCNGWGSPFIPECFEVNGIERGGLLCPSAFRQCERTRGRKRAARQQLQQGHVEATRTWLVRELLDTVRWMRCLGRGKPRDAMGVLQHARPRRLHALNGSATQRPRWYLLHRGSKAGVVRCMSALSPSGWHRHWGDAATTKRIRRRQHRQDATLHKR
jgi:hypothetical protein